MCPSLTSRHHKEIKPLLSVRNNAVYIIGYWHRLFTPCSRLTLTSALGSLKYRPCVCRLVAAVIHIGGSTFIFETEYLNAFGQEVVRGACTGLQHERRADMSPRRCVVSPMPIYTTHLCTVPIQRNCADELTRGVVVWRLNISSINCFKIDFPIPSKIHSQNWITGCIGQYMEGKATINTSMILPADVHSSLSYRLHYLH